MVDSKATTKRHQPVLAFSPDKTHAEVPGNFVQYGVSVQLGWMLSRKITASLGYRFIIRDADVSRSAQTGVDFTGNYKQNRVDFGVHYTF